MVEGAGVARVVVELVRANRRDDGGGHAQVTKNNRNTKNHHLAPTIKYYYAGHIRNRN